MVKTATKSRQKQVGKFVIPSAELFKIFRKWTLAASSTVVNCGKGWSECVHDTHHIGLKQQAEKAIEA